MHTPPSVRRIVRQRVAAVTVSVFAAGLLFGVTSSAGAAPAPTVSQVQAKLKSLELKSAQYGQQYDQVKQELASTDQRLALINKQLGQRQHQVRRDAAGDRAHRGDGVRGRQPQLLGRAADSGNPQQILNQSSILLELSATNEAQISQFLAAAKQLTATAAAGQADQGRHRRS